MRQSINDTLKWIQNCGNFYYKEEFLISKVILAKTEFHIKKIKNNSSAKSLQHNFIWNKVGYDLDHFLKYRKRPNE